MKFYPDAEESVTPTTFTTYHKFIRESKIHLKPLDNISKRFQHLENNLIRKNDRNLVVDNKARGKIEFIEFVGKENWRKILEEIKNIVVWPIRSCE